MIAQPMPPSPEPPNLHDATLVSIEVDWASGQARCLFEVWIDGPATLAILVEGLRLARIPRDHPWGRSVSVNRTSLSERDGLVELGIEMQSGDEILLRAETVEATQPRSA
jgi:hypothetical protein